MSQLRCWMVHICRMALGLRGVLRRLRIWVKPTDINLVCKTVFHSHFKLFLKIIIKYTLVIIIKIALVNFYNRQNFFLQTKINPR